MHVQSAGQQAGELRDIARDLHAHVNIIPYNTVEGLRHTKLPIFSVQYHPEAAPGPNDAAYFFEEFAALITKTKED